MSDVGLEGARGVLASSQFCLVTWHCSLSWVAPEVEVLGRGKMVNSWHQGTILPVETDVRKENKGR